MNLLDKEVFAVLTAAVLLASVFSASMMLGLAQKERYAGLGLLSSDCVLGNYPKSVYDGENITLCVFIENHLGHVALLEVRYKVSVNGSLPTDTSPAPDPVIASWEALLGDGENTTLVISVPVNISLTTQRLSGVALIFELWYLNPDTGEWEYTGRWVHLYVTVTKPPLGG